MYSTAGTWGWWGRVGLAAASLMLCVLLGSCARQQAATLPAPPQISDPVPPPQPTSPLTSEEEAGKMPWEITSSAFEHEGRIPTEYTCEGSNISPPLEWTDPPEGTAQLALICDDPDAPRGTFVHWVIYGIPADVRQLPEDTPQQERLTEPVEATQGPNSANAIGYRGPCPPPGPAHRYYFRLYALSSKLDLAPNATKADLLKAMEGKIVAETELMGTFSR